jgi:isoquinoline 1-oxidoreductase beta subunit
MVLKEALPLSTSQVGATSFAESPIPSAAEVPAIEVVLLDVDDPPSGAGETAIVAAGGAIANAVRDATGMRIQQLPLRPERLQRMLSRSS